MDTSFWITLKLHNIVRNIFYTIPTISNEIISKLICYGNLSVLTVTLSCECNDSKTNAVNFMKLCMSFNQYVNEVLSSDFVLQVRSTERSRKLKFSATGIGISTIVNILIKILFRDNDTGVIRFSL